MIDGVVAPTKIYLIDSGIDFNISKLEKYIDQNLSLDVDSNGYIIEKENADVKHMHGTVIALIIKSLCENISITSMNILNERLTTDGRILIYAIEKAIMAKPDIIHLSLGTTRLKYFFPLKRLVKLANKNNILVVAAANNNDYIKSYPAYLKNVIGVKGVNVKDYSDFYFHNKFYLAPFDAKNIHEISGKKDGMMKGNSYAAAYITGHIAKIRSLTGITDCDNLKKMLQAEALINMDKRRGGFYNE
jgi:subtilisin family serine protease